MFCTLFGLEEHVFGAVCTIFGRRKFVSLNCIRYREWDRCLYLGRRNEKHYP